MGPTVSHTEYLLECLANHLLDCPAGFTSLHTSSTAFPKACLTASQVAPPYRTSFTASHMLECPADPYVAAPPHLSSSQGLNSTSRSFPIPTQTMPSSGASSFPIPTPSTSGHGTAAPPGANSAARVFSSFPGASSFQPPPGSGIGSGAAAPGGLGGVEGAILEKMKRAAERERMLREAAKEAEAEGS
eukprot:1151401-Pelagomonas_calceolata.AAC.4